MASCHSLTLIGGEPSGDPLEVVMFKGTDWELDEQQQDEGTAQVLDLFYY